MSSQRNVLVGAAVAGLSVMAWWVWTAPPSLDGETDADSPVAAVDSAAALERPMLRRAPPRDVFTRAFIRARLAALGLEPRGFAGSSPRVALVSGNLVRVGDRLDVFEITRIDSDGLRLRAPSGTVSYLPLGAERLPK